MTAEPQKSHRDDRTMQRRLAGIALAMASLAGTGLSTAPFVHADAPVDVIDVDQQRARIVAMSLTCSARNTDDGAAVRCRWSTVERASGYRLVRVAPSTDLGRTVVARIDDVAVNTYLDAPVRRGVRYLYVVQALDSDGHLLGASRPVHVGVADVDPHVDVEPLRLECAATSSTSVRCSGGVPSAPARTLTLWRSVDGAAREQIASFQQPFPASYGDSVREGTTQVHYAIIATDGAGEIVARSRAELVTMPAPTGPVAEPVRPDVIIPPGDVPPLDVMAPPAPDDEVRSEPTRDTQPIPPVRDAVEERPAVDDIDDAPARPSAPPTPTTTPDPATDRVQPDIPVTDAEPDRLGETGRTRTATVDRAGRGG